MEPCLRNRCARLAGSPRDFDRGYGHFTTRQNIQFNWPELKDTPDILDLLASVEMHAIQTSGNCIRNVTADQYAGVAADEVDDPRVWSEVIRQWSTLHPEFSFLPRKFKIAVTGAHADRAAIRAHDIGIEIKRGPSGEVGFEILVGGGQGRTPMLAKTIRDFLPQADLLAYLEAILRVYNRYGRRDNKYKARIKILVHERGIAEIRDQVEWEFDNIKEGALILPDEEVERIRTFFAPPVYDDLPAVDKGLERARLDDADFDAWVRANTTRHRRSGYSIVNISLKPIGGIPGDATADQMEGVADLADQFSLSEIRVTHEQNLVLPHVRQSDLHSVWLALRTLGLATANIGMISDIIACPGLDYCALANARSIPLSQQISERFASLDRQFDIGELKIKIPAASTPADTTMSAISACSASTGRARSTTRSRSAEAAPKTPASARFWARPCPTSASSTSSSRSLRHTSNSEIRANGSWTRIGGSASSPSRRQSMPLIRNGAIIEDSYAALGDDDAVPARGGFTVGLARWIAERDALRDEAARRPVGVRVPNDADVEGLADDVDVLSLVELAFPAFTDGRAYSQARLLRDRLGFKGELRATGVVLRDQFQFMHRAGFDSYAVTSARALDQWRRALDEISVHYQPASDRVEHAMVLRHPRLAEAQSLRHA